jgi:hypothetical protein
MNVGAVLRLKLSVGDDGSVESRRIADRNTQP